MNHKTSWIRFLLLVVLMFTIVIITRGPKAEFILTVEAADYSSRGDPPRLVAPIPDQTWSASSSINFNPQANLVCTPNQDDSYGSPSWSATGLSGSLTINPGNGRITGSTPATGPLNITVSCTNAFGGPVSDNFVATLAVGQLATGKFVDCSLAAAGNGSLATPWNLLSRVTGMTTSTDLWLKAGSTCLQPFTVNWPGTAADRVVVGSYYVSGGVAYQLTPTNFTLWRRPRNFTYAQPRAKLRGTYQESCRELGGDGPPRCYLNHPNPAYGYPGPSVPSSYFAGMVNVSAPYVTIQDLHIADIAGRALQNNGGSAVDMYTIVQRNFFEGIAGEPVVLFKNKNAARFNQISKWGLCWADGQVGRNSWCRGEGISVGGGYEHLIEGNDFFDGWLGAVGVYGKEYVLMRGNESGHNYRGHMNDGSGHEIIMEQNKGIGGCNRDPYGWAPSGCPGGDYNAEHAADGNTAPASSRPGSKTIYRNNLGATGQKGLGGYISTANANARVEHRHLGNTLILPAGQYTVRWGLTNGASLTLIDLLSFQGNLFVDAGESTSCNFYEGLAAMAEPKLTTSYNFFTTLQGNATCRGTGDVVSTNTGIPAFTWHQGLDNYPSDEAFRPSVSGLVDGAGTIDQTVVIGNAGLPVDSVANWTWALSQRVWLPQCNTTGAQVPEAEWVKALTTDYCGNPRTTNFAGALKPL